MAVVMVVLLLGLAFLGLPIAWALGISSYAAVLFDGGFNIQIMAQKCVAGMNSFPMLAVPFFILAGDLMTAGGITRKLLDIARALIGWVKGSVSIVCIVASCFFGAISGSAIATASAIGGMTIPDMLKDRYSREYAAAVTTAGAICGPLIPPSIGLIVYASIVSVSVNDLFLGTLIPGILYGALLCLFAYLVARKRNYPTKPRASVKEILTVCKKGFWAMLMPVLVLGSIFGGIATATEASALAVAYALIVGLFIHRDLKLKDLYRIFLGSCITTSTMFILFGTSEAVGWIIAVTNVSAAISNWIISVTTSRLLIIAFITVVGLIFGCLMDAVVAILIMTPVFINLAAPLGYTNIEFGVIVVTLLMLGHITPPVGASLLLSNSIAGANIGGTIKEALPFFCIGLGVVILLWFCPLLISALL
ncbi:MAG: TRAP transporter large permease [Anaerotruncus sp.]|nr:TRAP transporter large permease [Anaerotruncus sp.]